ncbi:MAG: hypothetical protein JRF47_10280, partial [Deltaproteobacteria bacterium]|nr:hypothetical protein [Deltaproteobacteria bacterium]
KEVRGIVARYYLVVRSVLKEKPHLRKCLTRCRHCQILFFTHPRNAGRSDLRCPFGCRQAHRSKNEIQRSIEYYRSKEGKLKKKYLNDRRNGRMPELSPDGKPPEVGETEVDQTTVFHIQMVTGLIQGRAVSLKEVIGLIDKVLRQHSIDIDAKLAYAWSCQQKAPP